MLLYCEYENEELIVETENMLKIIRVNKKELIGNKLRKDKTTQEQQKKRANKRNNEYAGSNYITADELRKEETVPMADKISNLQIKILALPDIAYKIIYAKLLKNRLNRNEKPVEGYQC